MRAAAVPTTQNADTKGATRGLKALAATGQGPGPSGKGRRERHHCHPRTYSPVTLRPPSLPHQNGGCTETESWLASSEEDSQEIKTKSALPEPGFRLFMPLPPWPSPGRPSSCPPVQLTRSRTAVFLIITPRQHLTPLPGRQGLHPGRLGSRLLPCRPPHVPLLWLCIIFSGSCFLYLQHKRLGCGTLLSLESPGPLEKASKTAEGTLPLVHQGRHQVLRDSEMNTFREIQANESSQGKN